MDLHTLECPGTKSPDSGKTSVSKAPMERKIKRLRAGRSLRTWIGLTPALLMALVLTASAFQTPQNPGQQPGSRGAGVKPKRKQERRDKTQSAAKKEQSTAAITQSLSPILASADF